MDAAQMRWRPRLTFTSRLEDEFRFALAAKAEPSMIELPASVAAKVLLLNEMISQKVRPAALARRLRVTPQEVTRLIDLRHTTKIDGIAGALKALGKTMEIRAV